jgi:hypothetical protein
LNLQSSKRDKACRLMQHLQTAALPAVRAVKLTLVDSGMDDGAVASLFRQVALEDPNAPKNVVWTADLNKRRFELVDLDIQGRLSGPASSMHCLSRFTERLNRRREHGPGPRAGSEVA